MPDSQNSAAARDAFSLEIEQGVSTLYQSSKARVRLLVERLNPELQTAGYLVLRHVMVHEPIRAGDIAHNMAMDKSAVSRQLTALREMGLVDTAPDPEDGRASLVVSTTSAKEKLAAFRLELKEDYRRVLGDWDAADIENFARLLARFNESR